MIEEIAARYTEPWRDQLRDLPPGAPPSDALIVELERKLNAASLRRSDPVAEELLKLVQLGSWPLAELQLFFLGDRGKLSPRELQAAVRSREEEIRGFSCTAFMALPFRPDNFRGHDDVVYPSCLWEEIKPVRVDRQVKGTDLFSKLRREMDACDLFVADLTGNSPNVYYEVGYLEKAGKPGLFFAADTAERRFYLYSRELLFVPPGPEGIAWSRSELRASLRELRRSLALL
jgi:hypothetical protein